MNGLYKAIIAAITLVFLSACAYDPATGGYYSSSSYGNDYYGQSPSYGYQSNAYSGYQQPTYGYSNYGYGNPGYQQSPYGYANYPQRPYCPDDDD